MKTISEKNKLIDKFNDDVLDKCGWSDFEMNYHTDWNNLMPVVGRITEECEEPEEIDNVKYALLIADIDSVFEYVVDYIESKKS